MRILFAVLSPISVELGASQTALNLSKALGTHGIEAVVWTPHPVPKEIAWWRRMQWMRRRIAEHVQQDGAFDMVDVPPVAVTSLLRRQCTVIARSVQPDLIYLWFETVHAKRVRSTSLAGGIARAVFNFYLGMLVIFGWYRAKHILCLGTAEFNWMKEWFPWWRKKLSVYVNAIGDEERRRLAEIRQHRKPPSGDGVRFLWLGRWAAHKGVDILLEFIRRNIDAHAADSVTIAGCGAEAASHIAPELLKEGRVRIVPSYDRGRLLDLLRTHDAGLFTSRAEGWGLTLQEMLESGMPVYATEAGAVHDLRGEFPSLIRQFPPLSPPGTATFGGSAPRDAYFERFSWTTIAARYLHTVRDGGRHRKNGVHDA